MLRSYRALRRIVGFLGVALPIVVAVWGGIAYHSLQNSISESALTTTSAAPPACWPSAWPCAP